MHAHSRFQAASDGDAIQAMFAKIAKVVQGNTRRVSRERLESNFGNFYETPTLDDQLTLCIDHFH